MKLTFQTFMLVPLLALPALSQTPLPQPVPLPIPQQVFPQIRQFLGLTDAQVTALIQNNNEYNSFSFQQQRQIGNAQAQIAVETAKQQLDPNALGTLYAGIESACRDLRDKAKSSQQQNMLILTDAQKTKLNTLNDAVKLIPTISEAQSGNLLSPPNSPPFSFNAYSSSILTGVIGFPGLPGCSVPGISGFVSGGILSPVPLTSPADYVPGNR